MTDTEHNVERRKHYRFSPHFDVFASLNPKASVLGRIVDISMGGLAFCYVAGERRTDESSSLTISRGDGSFHIEGIPFRVIWDTDLPRRDAFPQQMVRHCGIRFVGHTNEHKIHIARLIQECGDPEDPPCRLSPSKPV